MKNAVGYLWIYPFQLFQGIIVLTRTLQSSSVNIALCCITQRVCINLWCAGSVHFLIIKRRVAYPFAFLLIDCYNGACEGIGSSIINQNDVLVHSAFALINIRFVDVYLPKELININT